MTENIATTPFDDDLGRVSEALDTLEILENHIRYVYKGKSGKKHLLNLISKESGSALQITLTDQEYKILEKYTYSQEEK